MKLKKILSIFILSVVITTSFAFTAFGEFLTETSLKFLYAKNRYAESSTLIVHTTNYSNANIYVYIESLDSDGYRVNASENYNKPKTYTSVSFSSVSGVYRICNTVKDYVCANRYLCIEV